MSVIPGISDFYPDPEAAVSAEGRLFAAAREEQLARKEQDRPDRSDSADEAVRSPKGPRRRISGWRKWVFRLLLATVVPALFLILLEVGLRVCGFGYPTGFFVKIEDRDACTTNRRFGWRFFPPAMSRAPVVCELPAVKGENTYRIFVLGGSAAKGTPDPAFSFGRMLEAMLTERYPGTRFDVINAAMTAINSHVVLPIARDCSARQGDLFVIYMGNNEVVGPYGGGAIFEGFSGNLDMIRAGIFLKSTRIGQLIERIFDGHDETTEWKGMMMFLKQRVRCDDPKMERIYSHFRANLVDICNVARKCGAKVILCTAAVNLRDSAPFAGMGRADIAESQQKQWTELYAAGISLSEAGKHVEAVEVFDRAMQIDDQHAELHFRLAQSLYALKRFADARGRFIQARDLDTLRFRADTRINQIIREVAEQHIERNVYLVDAERRFAQSERSPHEIPGRELFHEHVHMTPEGNYLLAKACFERIAPLLPDSIRKGVATPDAPSRDRCFELVALTYWDRYQIHKAISDMLKRAPFFDQLGAAERRKWRKKRQSELLAIAASPEGKNRARRWYAAAIKRAPNDLQLQRKFAHMLRGRGDYGAAAQQWRDILKRFPKVAKWRLEFAELLRDDRQFSNAISQFREAMRIDLFLSDSAYAEIGKMLMGQGKRSEAETLFREALTANPQLPMARSSLGAILYEQGKHAEAIRHFQKALEIDPNLAIPHHNLAMAFVDQDNLPEAIRHYREFLRIEPDDLVVRHNLASLLLRTGRIRESIDQHRQVLARQSDYHPTLVSLAMVLATCEDPELRNGSEALKIMEPLSRRAGGVNCELLSVLAMAYAETGQFDQAITAAEQAIWFAKINRQGQLVAQFQRELAFYRQSKPYRDSGKR